MSEQLGKTVGEYQLIEYMGESENAIIYKGFQPSMNRYVAVKVLKPGATRDPSIVQAFLQRGSLAAQLQHPNILPVYDSGQAEGVVYQASLLVETGVLRDHLNEFYNPQQASKIFTGLVEGLEFIHSQGYIHGNIKSSNIFLDQNRRPLLADFGASQLASASPSSYMAPEQVQGGVVDRRTDIYALGILLYEMLVGELPPAGMIVSPRARRPDLPEALERVVLKALAHNPDQRYQTAREFQAALNSAVQQPAAPVPTQAPAPSPAPAGVSQSVSVEQPKGTNWVAIILGVLLVGIICVGAIVFVPRLFGEQEGTPDATQPDPEITAQIPTQEERPTDEPRPTEPPEQPTEPPEQPTEEPPPEQPTEEPPEGGPPGEGGDIGDIIGDLCGSTGFILAAVAFGGVVSFRKRKRSKFS